MSSRHVSSSPNTVSKQDDDVEVATSGHNNNNNDDNAVVSATVFSDNDGTSAERNTYASRARYAIPDFDRSV